MICQNFVNLRSLVVEGCYNPSLDIHKFLSILSSPSIKALEIVSSTLNVERTETISFPSSIESLSLDGIYGASVFMVWACTADIFPRVHTFHYSAEFRHVRESISGLGIFCQVYGGHLVDVELGNIPALRFDGEYYLTVVEVLLLKPLLSRTVQRAF